MPIPTKKYRVFIVTTRGRYWAAASDSVNGLTRAVEYWLDGPQGRHVYDDQIQGLQLYKYVQDRKDFTRVNWVHASSRRELIRELRKLGGR